MPRLIHAADRQHLEEQCQSLSAIGTQTSPTSISRIVSLLSFSGWIPQDVESTCVSRLRVEVTSLIAVRTDGMYFYL